MIGIYCHRPVLCQCYNATGLIVYHIISYHYSYCVAPVCGNVRDLIAACAVHEQPKCGTPLCHMPTNLFHA